jgi:uncharacterized protein YllA (UPF0747 family)
VNPAATIASVRARSAFAVAGFTPQVETLDGLSLVFHATPGADGTPMRTRVPVADAERVAATAERGSLGPNVLLRPVIERCLLPTVAYLAGPGELAYFAQVAPVADATGLPMPLALPRWAAELHEPRSLRVLERLGLRADDLRDPHAAETTLARAATPEPVQDALERLRVTIETQAHALASATRDAGELLPSRVTDGLQRELLHRVARFERRAIAAVKRREDALMRDVAHARAAFAPLGKSPERVLNLLPLLARHGTDVLERMRDAAAAHADALVQGTHASGQ